MDYGPLTMDKSPEKGFTGELSAFWGILRCFRGFLSAFWVHILGRNIALFTLSICLSIEYKKFFEKNKKGKISIKFK